MAASDDQSAQDEKVPSKELAIPGDMLVIAGLAGNADAPKVPVSKGTKKGR